MVAQGPHILIIGASWVGDMIMSQALFMILKKHYPEAVIDVLAPEWTRPLLDRMPEVSRALNMDIKHGEWGWSKRKQLGKALRKHHYDQCIVLPNSIKSAIIPYFANIPKRTGWLKEPRYILLNDLRRLRKKDYPLMVQRFMALAYEPAYKLQDDLPLPRLSVDASHVSKAMCRHQLNTNKQILILCPGAEYGPSKRWPEQHYAVLANQFLARDWQVWLFGSQNDTEICEEIDRQTKSRCQQLAGKTSLDEAIDLMSLADLVITNDSGLMHMAAALDRHVVAIYGSTSTEFTPPLSKHSRVVKKSLECSPCYKRECPLKHHDCMQRLSPEEVITISEQAMSS